MENPVTDFIPLARLIMEHSAEPKEPRDGGTTSDLLRRSSIDLISGPAAVEAQVTRCVQTVNSCFFPDALFTHPLFVVRGAEAIAGIYEFWMRSNWCNRLEFNSIAFDERTSLLFVDVTQHFHHKFRHLAIPTAPNAETQIRLIATFKLRKVQNQWWIERQDDWYGMDRLARAVTSLPFTPLLLLTGLFFAFLTPILLRLHDVLIAPLRQLVPQVWADNLDWVLGKRGMWRRVVESAVDKVEEAVGLDEKKGETPQKGESSLRVGDYMTKE